MDPVTGMIRIRVPLDRETRDKYILSVEARNGISTGYCQVRIESLLKGRNEYIRKRIPTCLGIGGQVELNVEDVNDNGPTFPTSSVRISVAESHPLHAPLYVAHAVDPDVVPPHPIRYALGQNSNDLFGIDARSGELYLSRRLDYETQQRHGLLIRAVDGGGLTANLSLGVEVQDVNDNPPVFERNEYHVEVPEGAKLDSQVRKIFITRPSRGHLFAEETRGRKYTEGGRERNSGSAEGGTRNHLSFPLPLFFPPHPPPTPFFDSFSPNSSSPRRRIISSGGIPPTFSTSPPPPPPPRLVDRPRVNRGRGEEKEERGEEGEESNTWYFGRN